MDVMKCTIPLQIHRRRRAALGPLGTLLDYPQARKGIVVFFLGVVKGARRF